MQPPPPPSHVQGFAPRRSSKKGKGQKTKMQAKRDERRKEYAIVQSMWRVDQSRAVSRILDGGESVPRHNLQEMTDFWGPVLQVKSSPFRQPVETRRKTLHNLWAPITQAEIMLGTIRNNSAPGPDGVSPEAWKRVPIVWKELLLNTLMLWGGCPNELTQTRTVFIPKTKCPEHPGEYRPISIGSVIIRHLHRVLAQRITGAKLCRREQRAFIPSDGTAENLAILDTILNDARSQLRELHIATLDMAKAFDTVSHNAIYTCGHEKGLPPNMLKYINNLYKDASTVLTVGKRKSEVIKLGRGVRQGDPLSPALFNILLDTVLESVREETGFRIGNTKVRRGLPTT